MAEVNPVSVPCLTPEAPSSSISALPANGAFRKVTSPFLTLPMWPTYCAEEKKCFSRHSLKHGQHPSSSLGSCCPALNHCHRLSASEFTTVLQSFHCAADTNLQAGVRHRAGAVTTPRQCRWVGRGLKEGRLKSWVLKQMSVFREKPGVVSTFPVTLPGGKIPAVVKSRLC